MYVDTRSASPIATVGPDLAGEGGGLSSADGAGSLLPAAVSSADVGQLIAKLTIESSFERRKTARQDRAAREAAMASAHERELAQMKSAADQRYDAAKVQAWTQIGVGAATLASMGLSYAAEHSLRNALLAKSDEVMKQVAPIVNGTSGLVSAGMSHAADDADRSAKAEANAAKSIERLVDEALDDEKSADDSIRKALDFLREYESTMAQSRSAALHKM